VQDVVVVECWERVQSHTVVETDHAIELDIPGINPGYPVENAERCEEAVREPEVYEHDAKGAEEELQPGHRNELLEGTQDRRARGALMEGVIQGHGDERRRPNTVRGPYQESATDAGQTISDIIRRQADEDLVAEIASIGLVEVLREVLDPDDQSRKWRAAANTRHDGYEHMLLLRKRARIQAMTDAE